ncbi:MAG: DUF5696 domain-containing protein, partial [Bacillota bacterium]
MLAILKKGSIIALLASISILVAYASQPDHPPSEAEFHDNAFVDDVRLDSNRYSHPNDMRLVDEAYYIELTNDDELTLENNQYALYMNEETFNIKLLDKATGYVWSTAMDNPNGGSFNGLLSSGIGLEYINLERNYTLRENIGLTDTQFTFTKDREANTLGFDIEVGGFCATRNCARFYPRYLEGDFTLEEMIEFGYTELDVGFRLELALTENGIRVHIPYDSIYDGNPDEIQLSSLIVFPSLGATEMDQIPGYMMIPDGVGALIRYEDKGGRFQSPYVSRFYGDDVGASSFNRSDQQYQLSLPIFGAVHGVDQHGFIGMIESGDMNARLYAYPNGASNLPYNLLFTKFDLKQTYRQSFTSDGSSGAMRIYQGNTDDITINYAFTRDENANYVGLSHMFQESLVDKDIIAPIETEDTDIPIHLQYLMADSKSQLIGKQIVEMTTVDDVMRMYTYFKNNGLTNQSVSLLGWNDGGYSGNLPSDVDFENALGRNQKFEDMIEAITIDDTLMLVNNYIVGSSGTAGLSYRNDVAEGVNRFKLSRRCDYCVYRDTYLLYPNTSKERAMSDLKDYETLGVDVMFESLGSMLYSSYNRGIQTRSEAYDTYKDVIDAYQSISHYSMPNAYALQGTNSYYNTPLFNNQYSYFDDLVPIIPVVLSGHIDMYSQFLNYNSLGTE